MKKQIFEVVITKCHDKNWWYVNRIGDRFLIRDMEKNPLLMTNNIYKRKSKDFFITKDYCSFIKKDDCKILTPKLTSKQNKK